MKAKRKIRGNELIIMHKKVVVPKIVKYWDKIWQNLHTKKCRNGFMTLKIQKIQLGKGTHPQEAGWSFAKHIKDGHSTFQVIQQGESYVQSSHETKEKKNHFKNLSNGRAVVVHAFNATEWHPGG